MSLIIFSIDWLQTMTLYGKLYGPIFKGIALNRILIATADLELNEQILNNSQHIAKGRQYKPLELWLGTGLLLSRGKKWYSRRKLITPTFHFKILEQFVEVFDQQTDIFVNQLKVKADGKTSFDIADNIGLATLDILTGMLSVFCMKLRSIGASRI